MIKKEFFKTPIWVENKKEFLTSLDKASNKYVKASKNIPKTKEHIKKYGDFGISHHSTPLTFDNNFLDLRNYIGNKSSEFLDFQGFDVSSYTLILNEFWVQEFSKKGGGHHSAHVHWNQHVSGFYFLKCSDKTSYPVFHEPRQGAEMTKLPLKNQSQVTLGTNQIHYKPQPGMIIIFPSYVPHQFTIDAGLEPFRFIHFNIKAIEKTILTKEKK